jgi:diacylglycerol kinase (ATP)
LASENQKLGFVKGRLKGGLIASKGAFKFVTTEHSAMVQFSIAILLSITAFIYHISSIEWMFHIIVVFLVLAVEAANTAIEKLCDFIHDAHHEQIGFIKDVAAGAVWFAVMAAFIVELIIFYPKLVG